MKIAVNTRLLLDGRLDGISLFSYYTLNEITQKHPEHEFFFIFDRKFDEKFIFSDNITPIIVPPPTRHPFIHYYWFEFAIPKILKKIKPDLFLSPDGYLSLRTNIVQVPVIHDINFKYYPKDIPFFARKYYNYFFPKYAKKAQRIATVSEFSKNDIARSYNINKDKIDVVYNGSAEIYKPLSLSEKQKIKKDYTESQNFFIFIGSLSPRKNVERLFKAFDIFKKNTDSDFKLVIVGEAMHKTSGIFNTFSGLNYKKDIIFTGKLEQSELHKLLASAFALAFVPYFEGFGIPIIEAMNCDVPVICSNVTSMPEVAGNAALLVNPFSVNDIAKAMQKIIYKPKLRADLIENAKIQRQKFSWEKTAEKLWQTMEMAMNNL